MKILKSILTLTTLLSGLLMADGSYSRSENFGKNGILGNLFTNSMNYDEFSTTSADNNKINQTWNTDIFDQIGAEIGFKYSFSKARSKSDFYLVGSYLFYEGDAQMEGIYWSGEDISSSTYTDMKNFNLFLGIASSTENKIDGFIEAGLDYRIQTFDSKTTEGGYNTTYNLPLLTLRTGFLYPITKDTKIGITLTGLYGIEAKATVKNLFDSGTEDFNMDSVYGGSIKIPLSIKTDRHTFYELSYSFEKLYIQDSSFVNTSIQNYNNNFIKPNSEQTNQKIMIGFNYLF